MAQADEISGRKTNDLGEEELVACKLVDTLRTAYLADISSDFSYDQSSACGVEACTNTMSDLSCSSSDNGKSPAKAHLPHDTRNDNCEMM